MKYRNIAISKYRNAGVLLGVLLVLGAAVYFKYLNVDTSPREGFFSGWLPVPTAFETPETPETPETFSAKGGSASGGNIYTNPAFGFSFRHPDGFKITEFSDEPGYVVLVESNVATPGVDGKTPGVSRSAFQIFITPFDDFGPVTVEMIKKDLPNFVIENPQTVKLGGKTAPGKTSGVDGETPDVDPIRNGVSNGVEEGAAAALVFFSSDPSVGKTREAWFVWPEDPTVAGNYLYQVTSSAEFDETLSQIMATWRFQ